MPAKTKTHSCKQRKYPSAPECPFRAIANGPSGIGKPIRLKQLIFDVFRYAFERVLDIDRVWDPVKRYLKQEIHVDTKKEKCHFSTYGPEEPAEVMDEQFGIAEWQKNNGKHVFNVLIIVVDVSSDSAVCTRSSQQLHQL